MLRPVTTNTTRSDDDDGFIHPKQTKKETSKFTFDSSHFGMAIQTDLKRLFRELRQVRIAKVVRFKGGLQWIPDALAPKIKVNSLFIHLLFGLRLVP
jgi:hypothetical protein